MRDAVKVICGPVRNPACHGNHDRRIIAHRVQEATAAEGRRSGKENEFSHVASIQWQLEDALVIHDCSDTGAVCFNKGGVRLNFHLIGNLTYLKYDVDRRTSADLQDNSTLHVCLETG